MEAGAPTRELVFCPDCYRLKRVPGPCRCDGSAPEPAPSTEDSGRFAAAVDAPAPPRVPGQVTRRLVPAVAGAGILALVALIAVIVS